MKKSSLLLLAPPALTQASSSSKRGLAYLGDDHDADLSLLLSPNSSISWYYTWSPYTVPALSDAGLPFVPLIHGLADANSSATAAALAALPASSTHLLTFNEPDGTTASGGSAIAPADAARAYREHIVPLRDAGAAARAWKISHPATTGSAAGLAWLRAFRAACAGACPADFVAVHWYGGADGLADWLGTLYEFYVTNATSEEEEEGELQDVEFWVTELGLPQEDEDAGAVEEMLDGSVADLDARDYVRGYAWYGAARRGEGDWAGWTGDGVAVFDGRGGLTEVGAVYLGGEEAGFEAGMTGGAGGGCGGLRRAVVVGGVVAVVVVVAVGVNLW